MSVFFCKKSAIFGQNITFTQSNSVRAVLEIFLFCFHFLYDNRLLLMKKLVLQTMRLDCSKFAVNRKNSKDVTIFWYEVFVRFLWCCFVYLFTLSFWSKLHINIITGFGVMTICFYKGLTRNPEMGNNTVWVLPNIWRLGQVRNIIFGTNVFNIMLLNA